MQFLTAHEIAKALRLTACGVRQLIRKGSIPARKFGSDFRIEKKDFEEYLEKSRYQPKNGKDQ
jgi:excisionase family DNA binding protein